MKTNSELVEARLAALEADGAAERARHSRDDSLHNAAKEWISELGRFTIPATVEDYNLWLTGHLARCGKVTHFYDYPTPIADWYVAKLSFELIPLYGAQAINVIVPKGRTVTGDTGHSKLYLMDGFTSRGFHDQPAPVPCYTDTAIVE